LIIYTYISEPFRETGDDVYLHQAMEALKKRRGGSDGMTCGFDVCHVNVRCIKSGKREGYRLTENRTRTVAPATKVDSYAAGLTRFPKMSKAGRGWLECVEARCRREGSRKKKREGQKVRGKSHSNTKLAGRNAHEKKFVGNLKVIQSSQERMFM
jgi:hypothetical protein